MLRKLRVFLFSLALAGLFALGGFALAAGLRLADYRRASDLAGTRAFEQAVTSSEALSASLKKLAYAADGALARGLCAAAAADARSVSASLTVLPFATQELEGLLGFYGLAEDYAASLCALPEAPPDEDTRRHLHELSRAAAELADQLRALQGSLHEGALRVDRREREIENVRGETRALLSARLLDAEQGFTGPEAFAYDGGFSPRAPREKGTLSEAETKALAARAVGVEERELKEEYTAEGPDGRRCYSARGRLVGVSARGLEYLAQTRLVGAAAVDAEAAKESAERFLTDNGFEGLELFSEEEAGNLAVFRYAPVIGGALCPDDGVRLSVALDDGSVYAFDAKDYAPEEASLSWNADWEQARAALPDNVEILDERRLVRRSPGGSRRPRYEFSCRGEEGERLRIEVDGESGRQCAIELG